MSGSSGGGGYEYQARVAAYIGTYILAGQPLNWIEHSCPDTPDVVSQETMGPGDDIQIVLHDRTLIEIQVKYGLRKNKMLEALVPLIQGLAKNLSLHGILLIAVESISKMP